MLCVQFTNIYFDFGFVCVPLLMKCFMNKLSLVCGSLITKESERNRHTVSQSFFPISCLSQCICERCITTSNQQQQWQQNLVRLLFFVQMRNSRIECFELWCLAKFQFEWAWTTRDRENCYKNGKIGTNESYHYDNYIISSWRLLCVCVSIFL